MALKNRILVVDDDVATVDILHTFLTIKGFDVRTALSGREAIRISKEWHPHLILLDIIMPDLDGYETLDLLKEQHEDICVLMITGMDDIDVGRKALGMGASDFITKPLDLDYLERSVVEKLRTLLNEQF